MSGKITFVPVRRLGINSNDCNVYSNGCHIGRCPFGAIEQVRQRNFTNCVPISSWRNTFSVALKKEFGLPLGTKGYDDKGTDPAWTAAGHTLSENI